MVFRYPTVALSRDKWVALVASVWVQCISGSSYSFGIYSSALKSSQSYDQSTLDTIGFFKDVGANVGVLSGVLYNFGGSRMVLTAGAFMGFAGYFFMWLSVTGYLPLQPVPLMCLYMFLAVHSQPFLNTADVVTAVENFPSNRGTVVGIMKGFLGLSGAILIQIYRTTFNGNLSSFLLMLAILPTLLPLLLMYFIEINHADEVDDKRLLDTFSLTALTTAGYLTIAIIGEDIIQLGLISRIINLVILLMLLVSPIAIVIKVQKLRDSKFNPLISYEHDNITQLIEDADESEMKERSYSYLGEGLNLFQAMRTYDFWLLFLSMTSGMGSGLATVNNISQIGASLGYTGRETSTLVSLWSIWNFLGRFGGGYISDHFLRLHACARTLFMALALAIMSVGHVVISSGLPGALHVGSMIVGLCYGAQWSLMPTIASEIFGARHFGTIFNTITIASPIGSYVLSVRVVGYIYDMNSSSSQGILTCSGRHCFMLSFLLMAICSLSGFVIALVLFFRTRRFYKEVIFVRVHDSISR